MAASAPSLYIANARLVRLDAGAEPRPGGVLVEGDSIAAVALTDREQRETRSRAREVFDAAGMILMRTVPVSLPPRRNATSRRASSGMCRKR